MSAQDRGGGSVELIAAPWSIGLRPNAAGVEPGTWRAPQVLREAGLVERLGAATVVELCRPPYSFEAQPGSRIRNGVTLREHGLRLAAAVGEALKAGRTPVVVGGDCSVLLGCLAGARRRGQCGLIHVDGHTDFAHPGNHDFTTLRAAAGMDLALASGRGELLLTHWPAVDGPLVEDRLIVHLGDRTGADEPTDPSLTIGIDEILASGVDDSARRALAHLDRCGVRPLWLHVDLDVLDAAELSAVDSPGSPGLRFDQLAALLALVHASGRVIGVDIAIYDPDLDPGQVHAQSIVDCVGAGLGG